MLTQGEPLVNYQEQGSISFLWLYTHAGARSKIALNSLYMKKLYSAQFNKQKLTTVIFIHYHSQLFCAYTSFIFEEEIFS